MDLSKNKPFRMAICILLLCAVSIGVFSYTVHLRQPWFGAGGTLDSALMAGILLYAKNWHREGMLNVWAGMYRNPRSIEFPTLTSREINSSYPPGVVVPIHILSRLVGHEPTVSLIMAYNLFTHFLVAVLLSLTVFVFLRQIHCGYADAVVLSLIPVFVELLSPAALYHHQMGYFPDQAVIVLFVSYVFLEVLRDSATDKRLLAFLSFVQALVCFGGILTDWLFAFVALCVYVKRVFRGEIGRTLFSFITRSVAFWFSFCLALTLFAAQLWVLGESRNVLQRFGLRTGLSHGKPFSLDTYARFWERHVVRGYGKIGVVLIWASLICFVLVLAYACARFLLRKKSKATMTRASALVFMLLVPCYLQVFFLSNHCAHPFHYYTALKFSVPLAATPFVLMPVLLLSCFNAGIGSLSPARLKALAARRECTVKPKWSFLPPIMLALAGLYLYVESPRVLPQFATVVSNDERMAAAEFVEANTGYEDVLFTWHRDLEQNSAPLYLAFSMNRVYPARSVKQVYDKVRGIEGEYVVNLLSKTGEKPPKKSDMATLISRACDQRISTGLRLDKIPKDDFLALCKELDVAQSTE